MEQVEREQVRLQPEAHAPSAPPSSLPPGLVRRVAEAVAEEALWHNARARAAGGAPRYLNCFGPAVNILRDARWGRACEVGLLRRSGVRVRVGACAKSLLPSTRHPRALRHPTSLRR